MKKLLSSLLILFLLFTISCSKNNNKSVETEESIKKEGLFVTNYHSHDGGDGEILYLNENMELIDNYSVKGTDQIADKNIQGEITTYGIYGINNINLEDGTISNSISYSTIINIHDNKWAVDDGYLEAEDKYISKIKDLETNNEYIFNGAFRKSVKNENKIFIIVEDVFENKFSLVEFNTENMSYRDINNDLYNEEGKTVYELFVLNNKTYLMVVESGVIYNVDTNEKIIDLSAFDKYIDWSKVIFKWGKNIDENNMLICINYEDSLRFIKFDLNTMEIKEKFAGIGENVSISPPAAIDDEYIYLSLSTRENLCIIKKINIETEEVVQEKDITEYWSNKNGKYQIAYMNYKK